MPLPAMNTRNWSLTAMFEDFKAFEKAGMVLVDLHVNYEQMQAYAGLISAVYGRMPLACH